MESEPAARVPPGCVRRSGCPAGFYRRRVNADPAAPSESLQSGATRMSGGYLTRAARARPGAQRGHLVGQEASALAFRTGAQTRRRRDEGTAVPTHRFDFWILAAAAPGSSSSPSSTGEPATAPPGSTVQSLTACADAYTTRGASKRSVRPAGMGPALPFYAPQVLLA